MLELQEDSSTEKAGALIAPPSMLTPGEIALFEYAGANHCTGDVLEIGPFLGGGSLAALRGLRSSGISSKYVAIDRFVWIKEYSERFGPLYDVGGSFKEGLKTTISHFDGVLLLESDYRTCKDAFIESISFGTVIIDAPRTWNSLRSLFSNIATHLTSSCSILLVGAFAPLAAELALLMAHLPVSLIGFSDDGTAALYRCNQDISSSISELPHQIGDADISGLVPLVGDQFENIAPEPAAVVYATLCLELARKQNWSEIEQIIQQKIINVDAKRRFIATLDRIRKAGSRGVARELQVISARVRLGFPLPKSSSKVSSETLQSLGLDEICALGQALARPTTMRELSTLLAYHHPELSVERYKACVASLARWEKTNQADRLFWLKDFVVGKRLVDYTQRDPDEATALLALGAKNYTNMLPGWQSEFFPPNAPTGLVSNSVFDVALEAFSIGDSIYSKLYHRLSGLAPGGTVIFEITNSRSAVLREAWHTSSELRQLLRSLEFLPTIKSIFEALLKRYDLVHWHEVFVPIGQLPAVDGESFQSLGLEGRDIAVETLSVAVKLRDHYPYAMPNYDYVTRS